MHKIIKKKILYLTPDWLRNLYHACNAILACFFYRFPSNSLVTIGITGTKGKTSTSEFAWSVLTYGGRFKTGLIGTAHLYIGTNELANTMHMTMPSPWIVQRILRQMVSSGCTHVVLEVSSEGLKQNRHLGINYDIAVFTNLSPEHLSSHNNSFSEYRKAKGKLFSYVSRQSTKKIFPTKVGIYNKDDENSDYFSQFPIMEKVFYSAKELESTWKLNSVTNQFHVQGEEMITVKLPGYFNLQNAIASYYIGQSCGLDEDQIRIGIEHLTYIPGRMEKVDMGQNFSVFIDYAHEKLSIKSLLETLNIMKTPTSRIIILFGAEGGGRDKNKRKEMGLLASAMADVVILTNVDPYDDDPIEIINDIAKHVITDTKIVDQNVFLIQDRRIAIDKAFSLATENDIVCICGKGAEKTMVVGGQTIPWDEQKIVREMLAKYI